MDLPKTLVSSIPEVSKESAAVSVDDSIIIVARSEVRPEYLMPESEVPLSTTSAGYLHFWGSLAAD